MAVSLLKPPVLYNTAVSEWKWPLRNWFTSETVILYLYYSLQYTATAIPKQKKVPVRCSVVLYRYYINTGTGNGHVCNGRGRWSKATALFFNGLYYISCIDHKYY